MRTLETLKRFKPSRAQLIGGSLILSAGMLAMAAVPNVFTSGTSISSTAVNANFTDADTRITTLEGVNAATRLGTLEGVNAGARITTLEGVNAAGRLGTLEGVGAGPRLSTLETTVTGGNIVLAPSTAATGNILKGTTRFLHNFGLANTFLGEAAGNFTMTGIHNTAIGYLALTNNTTGGNNTASGYLTLNRNTTGGNNTAIGENVLASNTTGGGNTALGQNSLVANTIGAINTASGVNALASNTTGSNNTALGAGALFSNTTGNSNIAIGLNAGLNNSTGVSNIFIGNAGQVFTPESNTIRIGSTNHTRAFIAGIRGVTTGAPDAITVVIDSNGQLGTASSSQRVKDHIADMGEASSTLMKLRPVTFHYKSDQNPKGRSLQYGLIAEEVEKIAPGLVARSANGEIETVFYQHLTPMLLNEYQKQQRLIETQTVALKKQTDRVAALEMQAQEIVALKQELARMAAVLARLGQAEKVASVNR